MALGYHAHDRDSISANAVAAWLYGLQQASILKDWYFLVCIRTSDTVARAAWTRHGPPTQEQPQLPDDQCRGRAGGAEGSFLPRADQHPQAASFAWTAQRQRD